MYDKIVEALEQSAAVIKSLSQAVHDLQLMTLELSQKQIAITAALALRGISTNSEQIQEILNKNDTNDAKPH